MEVRYNPDIHHRKSIRLKDYDYSQAGAYFVTICTKNKECLLGDVVDGKIVLNDIGEFVQQCWLNIPEHFPNGIVDEYIIMPNHIHGIVIITVWANNYSPLLQNDATGATRWVAPTVINKHTTPLRDKQ